MMVGLRMKAKMAASLLVLFCFAASWAQKQPDANNADSAAIRHTLSDWTNAWNLHDAHGCAMQFSEDGDFVSSRTPLISHGRKDIEDHYSRVFAVDLQNAHRTDDVQSIRFLSPDVAYVVIHWDMTGEAQTAERKGLSTPVMVKHNGQWSIAVFEEADFATPTKK